MVLLYCQPSNGHLCIWLQLAVDAASSHLEFFGSACTLFTARLSHLCLTSRTSTQALLYLVKSWPFSLAASMLLPPRSEVKRCVCHRAKSRLKLMLMMMKLPIVRAGGFGGGVSAGLWANEEGSQSAGNLYFGPTLLPVSVSMAL